MNGPSIKSNLVSFKKEMERIVIEMDRGLKTEGSKNDIENLSYFEIRIILVY